MAGRAVGCVYLESPVYAAPDQDGCGVDMQLNSVCGAGERGQRTIGQFGPVPIKSQAGQQTGLHG